MRTHVTFRHPAPFLPIRDEEGNIVSDGTILSVQGADWFAAALKRIGALEIGPDLCQEDWGVVVFVKRNHKKFWIGLSMWPDYEQGWLAHIHHGSFAWFQRFSSSGNQELQDLAKDVHGALSNDPSVSEIAWYRQEELIKGPDSSSPTPV